MSERRTGNIVDMPFSRRPPSTRAKARNLGLTELARRFDPSGRNTRGHWCSRCRGIWYGCLLEVECPACGNRHG